MEPSTKSPADFHVTLLPADTFPAYNEAGKIANIQSKVYAL
jgi:hypothetical protein